LPISFSLAFIAPALMISSLLFCCPLVLFIILAIRRLHCLRN
jgi:hypothetical protein